MAKEHYFEQVFREYELEGLDLPDSNDWEDFGTTKKGFMDLINRAIGCLKEAAEYGKAISYYQGKANFEYDSEGELISGTEEDAEAYRKASDDFRKKRIDGKVNEVDHELYDILDKLEDLQQRVEKLED